MASLPRTGPRVPSYARQTGRFDREMREVHKKPPKPDNPKVVTREVLFSYAGHPVATDESPPYMVRDPEAIITGVFLSARLAATTTSTLQVKVNGTVVYTVTWDANTTVFAEDALNLEVGEYDLISVVFTAVGSGLSSVVVHIGYQVIQPL